MEMSGCVAHGPGLSLGTSPHDKGCSGLGYPSAPQHHAHPKPPQKQDSSHPALSFSTQSLELVPIPYVTPGKSFAMEAVGAGGLFAMFGVSRLEESSNWVSQVNCTSLKAAAAIQADGPRRRH